MRSCVPVKLCLVSYACNIRRVAASIPDTCYSHFVVYILNTEVINDTDWLLFDVIIYYFRCPEKITIYIIVLIQILLGTWIGVEKDRETRAYS